MKLFHKIPFFSSSTVGSLRRGAFCDDLAKGTRMLSPTYNTGFQTTDKPHWELGINCREEANFIHIGLVGELVGGGRGGGGGATSG